MEIENPAVGFSPSFWYSKKGICETFWEAFATRPPFPCNPRLKRPALTTLMNLKLTSHSRQTQLYHHLLAVVSVDLKTDIFRPILWFVDCLIGFWTENPGDGDTFLWTRIGGWNLCQLPHPLITWPIYQRRRIDAYQRTQIDSDRDGPCLFQIPYINIYLSIDRSIHWSIYQQTYKTDRSTHH